jgi:uncharacterized protein YecT (DUF1311 family)
MRIRNSSLVVRTTIVSAVLVAASAAVPASRGLATTDSAQRAKLSAPVIHESFTPLPCTGSPQHRSALQVEGCAEQQTLGTDKRIDALNRTIFNQLADNAARRRFTAGHKAWLSYRDAFCLSRSDLFEGGTEAAVLDATCVASINKQHVVDLKMFASDLTAE